MRRNKWRFLSIVLAGLAAATALCACSDDGTDNGGIGNDGWEGWYGWDDGGGSGGSSGGDGSYDTRYPVFIYNGFTDYDSKASVYVGADQCYFDGGSTNGGIKFEAYKESETSGTRRILTDCNGGEVAFVLNSVMEIDMTMYVCTALSTGADHAKWASDKFSLSVNGEDINLNAEEGVDEKWLWQQNQNWWVNANYIVASLGTVHFKTGYNTVRFGVKSEEVQLDYFLFQE